MKKWNDLKIGVKIGVSFLVLILINCLVNINSFSSMGEFQVLSEEFYKGSYMITNQSKSVHSNLVTVDLNIAYMLLEESSGAIDAMNKTLEKIDESIDTIKQVESEIEGVIDSNVLNKLESNIDIFKGEFEILKKLILDGNFEEARSMVLDLDGSYYTVYSEARNLSSELYDSAVAYGDDFNSSIEKESKKNRIGAVILGVSSVVIGVLIAISITRKIKRPIEELEIAANKMAKGDFNIDITYTSKDELGNLAISMDSMCYNTKEVIDDIVNILNKVAGGNFREEPQAEYIGIYEEIKKSLDNITEDLSTTMYQINVAAEEVSLTSDQVAGASQMLSQGATEQASSIEELSANITDITNKVKHTANNAKEANRLSLSAGKEVGEGNKKMRQMIKAMSDISNSSGEIGRIINTIDDIAFQTNILALNAAVEAARAGEAGKGFAVVADEVRNLAAKSAEAAKNTAQLIEESIKSVENGSNIVDDTAISLQKIMRTTNDTITLIDEIAKSSEEQAEAISQVTLGVDQISAVVQTNSATSEESAASSEELSGQAQILKELTEKFTLKEAQVDELSF